AEEAEARRAALGFVAEAVEAERLRDEAGVVVRALDAADAAHVAEVVAPEAEGEAVGGEADGAFERAGVVGAEVDGLGVGPDLDPAERVLREEREQPAAADLVDPAERGVRPGGER